MGRHVACFRLRAASSLVLLGLVCLPAQALAQTASIGGQVVDASGGVLPGVTVTASSPALIEQFRTGITDAQGRYRIVELRAGTYSVTFGLPGFSTLAREGIDLVTGFNAEIDISAGSRFY